jgi:flagellar protein FlaF
MDASTQAISAYGHAQKGATTDRGIEYQVFARTTASLLAAERRGKAGFNDLVGALHDNRRLWDALTVDLIDDGNQLSPKLRAQLLSLAGFVRRHAAKVLRCQASVQPIVDINQAVMNGLCGIAPQPIAVPSTASVPGDEER